MYKSKKNPKMLKRYFISFIVIIAIIIYNKYANKIFVAATNKAQSLLLNNTSREIEYDTIKLDHNTNYPGEGQKNITGSDGYFTTFTTYGTYKKTYKEYKQNGNSSWANHNYWDGTMETSGCGITAMSIILSGYGKNCTPEDLRKEFYPVLNGDLISSTLTKVYNLNNSDFYYDSYHLSNNSLEKHLKSGRPILICVWNKPTENRWTTSSHYLVLLACDDNHMVYVSNPNGLKNNSKSSGWYNINEISPYIAKAMFIEDYK